MGTCCNAGDKCELVIAYCYDGDDGGGDMCR